MKAEDAPNKISHDRLELVLKWGPDHVAKEARILEEMRLHAIPETLAVRKQDGDVYLEKSELLILVDWRAHRAKVYSKSSFETASKNTVQKVREVSRRAFSEYSSNAQDINKALKTLQELEGVTLQAATLLLSMYDPSALTYFSDELARYLHFEETKSNGKRADKNVSHTMKEYGVICEKVRSICSRIRNESGKEVKAVDLEIAAYRFGKSAERYTKDENEAALVPEEKPRKKRKTQGEIWEEEHPRGSDQDPFKHIHNCVDKGRDGSPTYDESGFELDYDKCLEWCKPMSRSKLKPTLAEEKRFGDYIEKKEKEEKRMAELVGDANFDGKSGLDKCIKVEVYKERVRNDLGKKTYHVTIQDFEDWHKKGFRAKTEEFDIENMDPERKQKLTDYMTGASLRK